MKIILSRKGFDGGSGGAPSPVFADGRLLSLPIPDKKSVIAYQDMSWDTYNVGEIVESITKGKIAAGYRAHLDPDLGQVSLSRAEDWQPLFGQVGAAQGHLRKQGVGPGDLFLFFGLFQKALVDNGQVKLDRKSSPKHIIWGWFQIERYLAVDEIEPTRLGWARYHPHFHREPHKSNTLYLAKEELDIAGLEGKGIRGAGFFPRFAAKLQLTAPGLRPSLWKLPFWMYPTDESSALSYHGKLARWQKEDDGVLLQTVGRGQEFVFDSLHYPAAKQWLSSLFTDEGC